jgi:hypothetical protein
MAQVFSQGFPHWIGSRVIRGATVGSVEELSEQLNYRQKQQSATKSPAIAKESKLLKIGNLTIPSYLEHYGFFYTGSPGSGKSQTICSNVHTILNRPNFRAVIIDRNGELLEKFYDPEKCLIFNPRDERSVLWSHRTEGVDMAMIASSLIPAENHKDQFWPDSAIRLLTTIFEVAKTNAEVYQLLSESYKDLADKFPDWNWMKTADRTGACVIGTARAYSGFYRDLPDEGEPFSFFRWASGNDPRSLIIPLFAEDIDRYKALVTMAIRQVLKGLIANEEGREIQTAVIVDELGALHPLNELLDVLAQGRKFKTCFIGATQTLSQLKKVYGQEGVDILLQTVRTKLILNCPDYDSAEVLAKCIGVQERVDILRSVNIQGEMSYAESRHESYAVHPSEIQHLPPLTGYVHISEGLPTALVSIQPVNYPARALRRIPRMDMHNHFEKQTPAHSGVAKTFSSVEEYLTLYLFEEFLRLYIAVRHVKDALSKGILKLSEYKPRTPYLLSRVDEHWQHVMTGQEITKLIRSNPNRQIGLIEDIMKKLLSEVLPQKDLG